jgi:tetratricopeptide (TPR) repeat protein
MGAEQFEGLSQKARQALAEGDAAEARQLYLQALSERHDSPDAHYGLATACFLMGDVAGAAFHFKEVTRLDPLRAGAYVNLGAAYNRLDQFDDALKVLRRGIQLDSQRAEGYYNLGLVYRRLGHVERAIQAYREATRLNPRMADAHYNLANILLEQQRHEEAMASYRLALEVHPKFEKARLGLLHAETYLRAQRSGDQQGPRPGPALAQTPRADLTPNGPVLTALHRATMESEDFGRKFVRILEHELGPALQALARSLLEPDREEGLENRIQKFEMALASMRRMQRNLQRSMKKLRQMSDRLHQVVGS